MFQLGSLVVLCGLLSGTSESDLDAPQKLKLDLGLLQKTTNWSLAKNIILGAFNTLDLDDLKLLSPQEVFWFRNNDPRMLDLQAGLSSDGKDMDLSRPLIVNASLFLPKVGSRGDFSVSLDLTTSLTIETDAQTGLPILALGKCWSDPETLTISLTDSKKTFINTALKSVSGGFKFVVAAFLPDELCPLFQFLLSNLNVNLIQDFLSDLLTGQSPPSI